MSVPYDNSQVYTRAAKVAEERYLRLRQMRNPRKLQTPGFRDIIRQHVPTPSQYAMWFIFNAACRFILEDKK
jgi:hypothetical protein